MGQLGVLPAYISSVSLERPRTVRVACKPLLIGELCSLKAIQCSLEALVDKEWYGSLKISIFGKKYSPDLETVRRPAVT